MKVMVTGGTGFVGSHTVAEVVRAGHDVKLLVRDPGRGNFRISLEIPLEYPPDLATQAARWALRTGRDILRDIGFSQQQRLRQSNPISTIKATLKARDYEPGLLDALKTHCQQKGNWT